MAATKRNAAGLTSAVPRATLNDEELVRIRPLTNLLSGIIVISRVAYFTYSNFVEPTVIAVHCGQ